MPTLLCPLLVILGCRLGRCYFLFLKNARLYRRLSSLRLPGGNRFVLVGWPWAAPPRQSQKRLGRLRSERRIWSLYFEFTGAHMAFLVALVRLARFDEPVDPAGQVPGGGRNGLKSVKPAAFSPAEQAQKRFGFAQRIQRLCSRSVELGGSEGVSGCHNLQSAPAHASELIAEDGPRYYSHPVAVL